MKKQIIGCTLIGSMIGIAFEKIYWSRRISKSMDRAYEIGFNEGLDKCLKRWKEEES